VVNTLGLFGFCLVVAVTFSLAAMSTGVYGDTRRTALPGLLVHSLVPIVVGYMTAHYLSYFVEQGQATVIQLSDPMVNGSNLLGTANLSVNYWLSAIRRSSPTPRCWRSCSVTSRARSRRTTARCGCCRGGTRSRDSSGCCW
jgi:hypothetical protein